MENKMHSLWEEMHNARLKLAFLGDVVIFFEICDEIKIIASVSCNK